MKSGRSWRRTAACAGGRTNNSIGAAGGHVRGDRQVRAFELSGLAPCRRWAVWLPILIWATLHPTTNGAAQTGPDLVATLSLDSLLNVPISAAAKYEQRAGEAPAAVTIVTAADIAQHGYQTLDQVLAGVRGFYTSYDRNYTYIGVRGFSRPTDFNNRILLLLNGHPVNEIVYGTAGAGTDFGVNLDAVERIEIVRGPGSALYGNNAMLAVINVVTQTGRDVDGLRATVQGGSFGGITAGATGGESFDNGVDVFVSAEVGRIDGHDLFFPEYQDSSATAGVATRLDWDRFGHVFTRASFRGLSVQARATARRKGIPTGAYGTTFNDPAARTLDSWQSVVVKFDQPISAATQIVLRGSLDRYTYRGWYPGEVLEEDATRAEWLGAEARLVWDPRPEHRLTLGSEFLHGPRADYRMWSGTETLFDANYPFDVWSLYAQHEFHASSWLTLTGGVRHDAHTDMPASTTPRAAAVVNPLPGAILKILYGEAFRVPNVYERHYSADDFKTNRLLTREQIRTSEIAWEQRISSAWFGTVSLYRYDIDGLIDTAVDQADSLLHFVNRDEVHADGVEIEVDARLGRSISGEVSYSLQHSRAAGRRLTNSPDHLAKARISAPLSRVFAAAAELRYEAERATVYETFTPAYLLTNLALSTTDIRGLRATALVRNVFDARYATPGGFEHRQAAIVQDGRTLAVKLAYTF